MRIPSFIISFTAVLLLIVPSSGQDSQREVLLPRFKPGNTYRFTTRTIVNVLPPGQEARRIIIAQQARFDASPRQDGKPGVFLKARTERLKVEMNSGGRVLTYDSLKPEDKETTLGRHFRASLNRSLELELDGLSRVVSSEEGGLAGAATPLPGMPQFGPDELKQIVTLIPQGFSEDPVRSGDEWVLDGDRAVGETGEIAFEITYRHQGRVNFEEHSCINIEFDGRLSGDLAISTSQLQGRMDFAGTGLTGRTLFDLKLETVRYNEQTVRMVLDLPGGQGRIPIEQQTELRLLQVVASQ